MRLLEVPADDLRVLGRAIPGSRLEPIGEAFVHVRPGLFGERTVGGIADQQMAEFEGALVDEVRLTRADQLLLGELEEPQWDAT